MIRLEILIRAWVRSPYAATLGRTLLHSLWEGAAVALGLAAVLCVARSSRARYAAASVAMAAMLGGLIVTFARLVPEQPIKITLTRSGASSPIPAGPIVLPTIPTHEPRPIDELAWLAPFWIAGVLIFHLRGLAGWMAARRLHRTGVCRAVDLWQSRLDRLKVRLRMNRPVALLESCLAEVPVVIGYVRPIILMPVGLMAGLPVEQVEAILLHELAHIRRYDYLVNLVQVFVEGLLFYHPAVWWISGIMRTERENCCDDLVVSVTGGAYEYASALTAVENARRQVNSGTAIAATGGNLVNRIQRLLGKPQRRYAAAMPVFTAAILTVTVVTALAALQLGSSAQTDATAAPKALLAGLATAKTEQAPRMTSATTEKPGDDVAFQLLYDLYRHTHDLTAQQANSPEGALQRQEIEDTVNKLQDAARRAQDLANQQQQANQAEVTPQQRKIDDALRQLEDLARRMQNLARQQQQAKSADLTAQQRYKEEMLRREAELLRVQMAQLSPVGQTQQAIQPDKVLFDRAISHMEHGDYPAARLTLNTLINTYASSPYLVRAKLAIADSWFREGGAHGAEQAYVEYQDFIQFFPNTPEATEAKNSLDTLKAQYAGRLPATPYMKWIREDVVYIISDEERKAFIQLQTDEEREQFVQQFWARRDPTPGTERNEFKEEHYRRIAYANEHYMSSTQGWRTDRGRIYIQYGPPDEIEAHRAGGAYQRPPQEGGGETEVYPFEQWRYKFIDGVGQNIVMEFVDTKMNGEYRMTMDPSEKDALFNLQKPPVPKH